MTPTKAKGAGPGFPDLVRAHSPCMPNSLDLGKRVYRSRNEDVRKAPVDLVSFGYWPRFAIVRISPAPANLLDIARVAKGSDIARDVP